jgi:hypothetical protein
VFVARLAERSSALEPLTCWRAEDMLADACALARVYGVPPDSTQVLRTTRSNSGTPYRMKNLIPTQTALLAAVEGENWSFLNG